MASRRSASSDRGNRGHPTYHPALRSDRSKQVGCGGTQRTILAACRSADSLGFSDGSVLPYRRSYNPSHPVRCGVDGARGRSAGCPRIQALGLQWDTDSSDRLLRLFGASVPPTRVSHRYVSPISISRKSSVTNRSRKRCQVESGFTRRFHGSAAIIGPKWFTQR